MNSAQDYFMKLFEKAFYSNRIKLKKSVFKGLSHNELSNSFTD